MVQVLHPPRDLSFIDAVPQADPGRVRASGVPPLESLDRAEGDPTRYSPAMHGLPRLVLIALLALLLPLKGMAAGGLMQVAGMGSHGHGPALMSADLPPCHQAEATADADAGTPDTGPSAGTCTHCAPCCIAVAPMWALPLTAQQPDREPAPAAAPWHWARLALALPDRPPRAV